MAAQKATQTPQKVKNYVFNVLKEFEGERENFITRLEKAVNERLLVGNIFIEALSQFIDDYEGHYVAYGYVEIRGKLKPLEVEIYPVTGRVKVRIGVMLLNFDVSEIVPEAEEQ